MQQRFGWVSLFALALLTLSACSSSQTDCSTSAAGSGQASGTLSGKSFDQVRAAYGIGKPDDVLRTTVLYVFDQPIPCCDIVDPGWDARITDGTLVVEMKLIGKTPGTYPVASGPNAGQGQASVNYTVSSTSGTPAEEGASGGTVTLESGGKGSFDLSFPDGQTTGTFAAVSCSGGHEP
jgi:hypothetical protein